MAASSKTGTRRQLTVRVAEILTTVPVLRGKTHIQGGVRGGARGGTAVRIARAIDRLVVEVTENNGVQRVVVQAANVAAAEEAVRQRLHEHHIAFSGK